MASWSRRGVVLLDDAGDLGGRAAQDAPVAGRVGQLGGQHGDRVAGGGVFGEQRAQRAGVQQRHVAVGHHYRTGHGVGSESSAQANRVAGAQLFFLDGQQGGAAQFHGKAGQVVADLIATVPGHYDQVFRGERRCGVHRVPGAAGAHRYLVQHLQRGAAHPTALAGGEHHYGGRVRCRRPTLFLGSVLLPGVIPSLDCVSDGFQHAWDPPPLRYASCRLPDPLTESLGAHRLVAGAVNGKATRFTPFG